VGDGESATLNADTNREAAVAFLRSTLVHRTSEQSVCVYRLLARSEDSDRAVRNCEDALLMRTERPHVRRLLFAADRPNRQALSGYEVVGWKELVERYIEPAERVGSHRTDLLNAAEPLLTRLDACPRLAVLDVPTQFVGDIRRLYGYVIEPSFRRDIDLIT
jgi:hypothetical protein